MTLLLLFNIPSASVPLSGDFALDGLKRPEYIYLGLEANNHELVNSKAPTIAKWRTVSAVSSPLSQGRLRRLAILAGGYFHVEDLTAWKKFDDTADPSFSSTSPFYWMVEYYEKLYMGDGVSYMKYDPRTDVLEPWGSDTSGELPEKCNIATVYRGRIVLARGVAWYMSAVEDAGNWEYFPPTQTLTMAVAGSNSEAGNAKDVIRTLIPARDDYLIFGCDHSIWKLSGDPLQAGQLDSVSTTIGMAPGNSWCKDPSGTIYFFASLGGVYRMTGTTFPQSISDAIDGQDVSIQKRLEDIDLAVYRIELEWDYVRRGLHLYLIPFDEAATSLPETYYWDSKNNAWWPDTIGAVGLIPFSSASVDGDLVDDRRVVIGCQDGYLRELDSLAKSDDGIPIDSHVTIGPMAAGGDQDVAIRRFKAILSKEKDGCTYEILVSRTPELPSEIAYSGSLLPGQNPRLAIRKRGAYVWLRLRNKKNNESFSVEELSADIRGRGSRSAGV